MSKAISFQFQLYVAGDSPNSVEAINNLNALCARHLPQRHRIEIIDVLREPERAMSAGILITPTLIKLAPEPCRTIVGTLHTTATLLQTLGLPPAAPPA